MVHNECTICIKPTRDILRTKSNTFPTTARRTSVYQLNNVTFTWVDNLGILASQAFLRSSNCCDNTSLLMPAMPSYTQRQVPWFTRLRLSHRQPYESYMIVRNCSQILFQDIGSRFYAGPTTVDRAHCIVSYVLLPSKAGWSAVFRYSDEEGRTTLFNNYRSTSHRRLVFALTSIFTRHIASTLPSEHVCSFVYG